MPKSKPDPKCKDCGGKGIIELFTSSVECSCVSDEQSEFKSCKFMEKFKYIDLELKLISPKDYPT